MIQISLDIDSQSFVLRGDFSLIKQHRRFKSHFKSYGGILFSDCCLELPYSTSDNDSLGNKETTFERINKLSKRFGFDLLASKRVEIALEELTREKEAFSEFSQKAENIRNNRHDISDIKDFITAVEKVIRERKLYRLQLLSAYHLAFSQNGCNFSVPGAGKTSIVYAAYAYLNSLPKENPKYVDRLLIISPLAAFFPWKSEFVNCFSRKPSLKELVGISPDDRRAFFHSSLDTELTLISYQSAASSEQDINNIVDYLKRYKVMVVLDEAHRIKNTSGGITAESILSLAKYANSRVVLTGTPAPNGYQDIYNLFKFIWPNNEIIKYTPDYLENISNTYSQSAKKSVAELVKSTSPFFMRIRKSDLGLPLPINHEPIMVDMDKEHQEIYNLIEDQFIPSIDYNDDSFHTFEKKIQKAKLIRLMQCVTNPRLLNQPLESYLEENYGALNTSDNSALTTKIQSYEASGKYPSKYFKLKELLLKILAHKGPEGKAIVWTIFVGNLLMLQEFLINEGIPCELLYGATPNESEGSLEDEMTREKIISDFHLPDSSFKVIIANPFAVGESISLHKACRNAIYLEKNFNAAMYMQSKDRVHRYGLKDDEIVHYYHLLSSNSIDSDIHARILMKEDRMISLIERDEIPLITLNMDDQGELADKDDFQAVIDGYYARKS